jgi:hypothetical protein
MLPMFHAALKLTQLQKSSVLSLQFDKAVGRQWQTQQLPYPVTVLLLLTLVSAISPNQGTTWGPQFHIALQIFWL